MTTRRSPGIEEVKPRRNVTRGAEGRENIIEKAKNAARINSRQTI
jgi:hypothetical protein